MKNNSKTEEILFQFFSQVYPLTKKDFEPITKIVKHKSYKKGDYILTLNQIETKTSLVLNGIVHQYVIIDGEMFTIDISLAGMSYNSFTSYVEETNSNQIQEAITDVDILYLEKKDTEKLLLENTAFCYIYTKLYEQVHLEREKRALVLQHKSAAKRYELFMETVPKAKAFTEQVPQKIIANYLSMTPETYSRVKNEYFKK